jgi:hypothetical protein
MWSVSLLPSATEITVRLGLADDLVSWYRVNELRSCMGHDRARNWHAASNGLSRSGRLLGSWRNDRLAGLGPHR